MTLTCPACRSLVAQSDAGPNAVLACPCGHVLKIPLYLAEQADGIDSKTGIPDDVCVDDDDQPSRKPAVISVSSKLASISDRIGVPERHYRTHSPLLWIGFMVGGAAWFAASVWHMVQNGQVWGRDELEGIFLAGRGIGPLLCGLGLWMLLRPVHILICSGGVIRLRQRVTEIVFWDDIRRFEVKETENESTTTTTFTLHLAKGRKMVIETNQFRKGQDLMAFMMQRRFHFMVDRAMETYQAGKDVEFAGLSLNQQGLRHGSDFLPWTDIDRVDVEDGFICVKKKGTWDAVWKIPSFNSYTVFLAMVGEHVPVSEEGEARLF